MEVYYVEQILISHNLCFVAGSSGSYPRMGSLCRVRVKLKADGDETNRWLTETQVKPSDRPLAETEATACERCRDSVLQVPLGNWTTLRLGVGQCDVTEACLERMHAGEECEVRVKTCVI